MSPHTNEPMGKEVTWAHSSLGDKINTKTELRGNQNEKWAAKQLVPPGYGIYPMANSTLVPIRFGLENDQTLTQSLFARRR